MFTTIAEMWEYAQVQSVSYMLVLCKTGAQFSRSVNVKGQGLNLVTVSETGTLELWSITNMEQNKEKIRFVPLLLGVCLLGLLHVAAGKEFTKVSEPV